MICVIPARGSTDTGRDVTVGACAFILFSFLALNTIMEERILGEDTEGWAMIAGKYLL